MNHYEPSIIIEFLLTNPMTVFDIEIHTTSSCNQFRLMLELSWSEWMVRKRMKKRALFSNVYTASHSRDLQNLIIFLSEDTFRALEQSWLVVKLCSYIFWIFNQNSNCFSRELSSWRQQQLNQSIHCHVGLVMLRLWPCVRVRGQCRPVLGPGRTVAVGTMAETPNQQDQYTTFIRMLVWTLKILKQLV